MLIIGDFDKKQLNSHSNDSCHSNSCNQMAIKYCVLLSLSAAVEANNGSTTCKYIHYRSKLDSYPF